MNRLAILVLAAVCTLHSETITLINTIPNGNLDLQPPVFMPGGNVRVTMADGFIAPETVALSQVSLAVAYVGGRTAPMYISILDDNGNSPGTELERWAFRLDYDATTLTVVTMTSNRNPMLLAGRQYWLALDPSDLSGTAIGWGLASSGYPGIQLPIAVRYGYDDWDPTQLNLANEFSVSGTTVPEPTNFRLSALSLLAATGALGIVRRRSAEKRTMEDAKEAPAKKYS